MGATPGMGRPRPPTEAEFLYKGSLAGLPPGVMFEPYAPIPVTHPPPDVPDPEFPPPEKLPLTDELPPDGVQPDPGFTGPSLPGIPVPDPGLRTAPDDHVGDRIRAEHAHRVHERLKLIRLALLGVWPDIRSLVRAHMYDARNVWNDVKERRKYLAIINKGRVKLRMMNDPSQVQEPPEDGLPDPEVTDAMEAFILGVYDTKPDAETAGAVVDACRRLGNCGWMPDMWLSMLAGVAGGTSKLGAKALAAFRLLKGRFGA